ncbi:Usually multiple acids move in and out Transporters 24 [Hibiscus trionum]|uniref:WAT1-related protein n=1 Tax=Hibiscus trionum TaxID=183268 RepID=A0A9W7IXC1_HIBTR|nr:Usually multiple acids move in and out Transporters 24 [Hibiscus trionum]
MTIAQVISAWVSLLYEKSYSTGTSMVVLIAYRLLVATIFVTPVAIYFERGQRPDMTWKIAALSILTGALGGVVAQNTFAASFSFAFASYITAVANLGPAITYILAIIFRMETLTLTTWPGRAKVIGTITSIGGAMIITFYTGPSFHIHTSFNSLPKPQGLLFAPVQRPILGAVLTLLSLFCYSLALILQAKLIATHFYPVLSTSWLMCGSSFVLSTATAMVVERDWCAWRISPTVNLLTIIFTGVFGSGVAVFIATWCMKAHGPIFVSSFSPLSLVFTILFESLLINGEIHTGSIIGGFLIILGIYITLWGKRAEASVVINVQASEPSIHIIAEGNILDVSEPS